MRGRPKRPKIGLNKKGKFIGVYPKAWISNGLEVDAYEWRFMHDGKVYCKAGYVSANDAAQDRTKKILEVCG